jgi:RNA polymerase sigma-70 factor (ECF subfamily)
MNWSVADASGLRAALLRRVRNEQLVDDILQDALITAQEKLRAGAIARPDQLAGYVYRVALNHLRNHRRKDKSSVSDAGAVDMLVDSQAADHAVQSIHGSNWAKVIRTVLEDLTSERDRQLLVRFYLDEEDKDVLCRELGLTELHFNRVIFRARERFREILERKGYSKSDFISLLGALIAPSLSG